MIIEEGFLKAIITLGKEAEKEISYYNDEYLTDSHITHLFDEIIMKCIDITASLASTASRASKEEMFYYYNLQKKVEELKDEHIRKCPRKERK